MMQTAQHNSQSAHRAARLRFALQMAEQAQRVGDRIAQEREKRNWSRPELARQMPGLSTGNDVYRWESGKHLPRSDTLEALADLFEISVADLHAGPVNENGQLEISDPFATEPTAADDEIRELRAELRQTRAELLAAIETVRRGQASLLRHQGLDEPPAEETGS